jgi:hypothetical protein
VASDLSGSGAPSHPGGLRGHRFGGYDGPMSETDNEPQKGTTDAERDLAEHERPQQQTDRQEPEVGLIADEELPEDLQPTDDNPLAKNPGDSADEGEDTGLDGAKVEGMPDMGNPGAPA